MAIVERISIEMQLEQQLKGLSEADAELCRGLLLAIRQVQRPDWFGALPGDVRTCITRWHRKLDKTHRTDPDAIRREVTTAESVYGLKRSRGNRNGSMSAFEFAANRLGISPNTVINKVGRKLPTKRSKK